MRVAVITDTHYGCKKNSKLFHDYFKKFYEDVFFPTIDKENIKTVIHMGDAFDSRKGIDFSALSWAKDNIFDPLQERGIKVYLIVGNHDSYYKNTNEVNGVDLLLREYKNVETFSETRESEIGGLPVLFVPWINQDNQERTLKIIQKTTCKIVFGHLELQGFKVNNTMTMDHGFDSNIFGKFERVYSGHFHTRSNDGKIYYLGNPYEMFWTDVNDTRGFHIFDTETLEHTPINNPHRLFYNIYYEDTPYQTFKTEEYADKIVKVIVRKKTDTKKFEKFIDKLYASNIAELKVVENFDIQECEEFEALESEDTISILNRYVEDAEINLDKTIVQKLLQEVYQEACDLV